MSEPSSTASATSDAEIARLQKAVEEKGLQVKQLKDAKAEKGVIVVAVEELKALKAALAAVAPKEAPKPENSFNRKQLEDLLLRRAFFIQSFEIYGGIAGLYDYGPTACAIKANLLSEWRSHFVLEENMLEVDCTSLTPEPVLKASGHVDRFCDIMVKDVKTGECLRADHLLEAVMEAMIKDPKTSSELRDRASKISAMADTYSPSELDGLFAEFKVKAPGTNNDLSPAVEFNMMFPTSIGPTGLVKGFLRPETAQGIFVNFKRLYEYNNFKLPFPVAQIGNAFRNEISPRAGVLRVREFTMAEIEHFVDPDNKQHKKFANVADLTVSLLSAAVQVQGIKKTTPTKLGEAVASGLIANQTLGYYIGRIHLFMMKIGVDPARIRFRQHLRNEMAHYACDCWDCELETSYGWIECVGCADRSAYDLTQHSEATGKPLIASENLDVPILQDCYEVVFNKGLLGTTLKQESQVVLGHYAQASADVVEDLEKQLQSGPATVTIKGKAYTITKEMVIQFKRSQKKISERKFTPSVIEPSFGIGRIIYSLLEQVYHVREGDAQRGWLALPPAIAPVKCSVLPLSNQDEFDPFLDELEQSLTRNGVSHKRDDSSVAIGRRYARTDEIAIPFGLTVDFQTVKDRTVTLRERNSMQQIRASMDVLPSLVAELCNGRRQWSDAVAQYGLVAPIEKGLDNDNLISL